MGTGAEIAAYAAVASTAASVGSSLIQGQAQKKAAKAENRAREQQRKIDEQRRLAEKRQTVRAARSARAEVISQGVGREVAGSSGTQGAASSVGGQVRGNFTFLDNITTFAQIGSNALNEAASYQSRANTAGGFASIFGNIGTFAAGQGGSIFDKDTPSGRSSGTGIDTSPGFLGTV